MAKFDFRVREELKRDRWYTIEAKDENEARHLLDGFKQKPKESTPNKENIVVNDYDILEVWSEGELDELSPESDMR